MPFRFVPLSSNALRYCTATVGQNSSHEVVAAERVERARLLLGTGAAILAGMAATSYPRVATEERAHPFGVLYRLVRTEDRVAPLIARLVLGFVIFPHGAQKLLGWFDGGGPSATIASFGEHFHLSSGVAILVMCAEFFGAIGLVLGLLGRVAAFGIATVMLGAIAVVHARVGLFMNWSGKQMGEGFEFHLLALALALIVMVVGSGKASFDRALTKRA